MSSFEWAIIALHVQGIAFGAWGMWWVSVRRALRERDYWWRNYMHATRSCWHPNGCQAMPEGVIERFRP